MAFAIALTLDSARVCCTIFAQAAAPHGSIFLSRHRLLPQSLQCTSWRIGWWLDRMHIHILQVGLPSGLRCLLKCAGLRLQILDIDGLGIFGNGRKSVLEFAIVTISLCLGARWILHEGSV